MTFNDHRKLAGAHAMLGASNYHWLNYSDEKLEQRWESLQAIERGTKLHEYARMAIELGIIQAKNGQTLNRYINDAIGYRMTPEQVLYYSDNCFGTADSISFKDELLRIHDLKTGETPASMHQLEIYAALFCLEYKTEPKDIDMELRLYQSDKVLVHSPQSDDILRIADKIVEFDKEIDKLK